MNDHLDFNPTLDVIDDLRECVLELKMRSARVNIEVNNKRVSSEKADLNRGMLYAAHLADMARVSLMNEYHRFKGQEPPRIETD